MQLTATEIKRILNLHLYELGLLDALLFKRGKPLTYFYADHSPQIIE